MMKSNYKWNCFLLANLVGCSFLLSSCSKNTPKIQDVTIKSIQVESFKLSKKNDLELNKVFFSIDQDQNKIYNAIPVDFYKKIDSVALLINVASGDKVELAVGDGEFKPYVPTDSIFIGNKNYNMKVRVMTPDQKYQKLYDIKINQYSADPMTFNWNKLNAQNLPETSADYSEAFVRDHQVLIYTSKGNATALKVASFSNVLKWESKTISGIAGVKQIAKTKDNKFVAVDNQGALHSSDNGEAFKILSDVKAVALLGIMPDKITGKEKILLLLPATAVELAKEQNSGKNYTFGYFEDGKLTRGALAPINYPVTKFTSLPTKAFNSYGVRTLGGVDLGGKSVGSIWYTTNGLDWLEYTASKGDAIEPSKYKMSVTSYGKAIYLYTGSDKENKLTVYYSQDEGLSWTKGKSSVMLPKLDEYGTRVGNVVAFADEQSNMYLVGGVSSAGQYFNDIWKGNLKISNN
ncbi:DUF6242 domain-containing protein [Porphyromonas pogonae]|uniref:DUF6242 domain-containing protein n=1 Tax=Porphyromonas pogonae TaxID=867595 RepID=UPI002E78D8F6|nr:DUF6242 domain-containing protein [Porphyromonas pogonae]